MIKIGARIPNPNDATNWYRGTGPLSNLMKTRPGQFDVELMGRWSYAEVSLKDVAFFQRPCSNDELEAMRICKRMGTPVVVDYDDLLFDVPTDNPAHRQYMNKETQTTIVSIMREADLIWVSTKELKRCIQIKNGSLNDKVYVIPNALDEFSVVRGARSLPPKFQSRQPCVMWRGSPTHERDVITYASEIAQVARAHPKTSFVFVGWNPWLLTEMMGKNQAVVSGALGVGEFMDFLYNTGPKIGQVPLHFSRFNRCKSNIAWLEMTWAGAVVLAPDWEEWRHPGVVAYFAGDGTEEGEKLAQESYREGLNRLVTMSDESREKLHRMSWNHIVKNFMLTQVNALREATLLAVLGRGEWPKGFERLEDSDEVLMELE